MKATRTKQLSVSLENRPGQVARVCACLAERKINIVALSVIETSEQGILRLVVDKPDEAAKALKGCPMTVAKKEVLLVELPNKVGVMATVAEKLAAKGINITFVYGSTGKTRGITYVVLSASNLAAAKRILARM